MVTTEIGAWYREKTEESSRYASYQPDELLKLAIKIGHTIKRTGEKVPVADVITEDSVIDKAHADKLANSIIYDGLGQISTTAHRARFRNEELVYDVIDGFHRSYGQRLAWEFLKSKSLDPNIKLKPEELEFLEIGDRIDGTVIYNLSDQRLYGYRLLAANSVKTIQFPRIAEWIQKLFAFTPWAEAGLTPVQAFGVTVADSKRSYNANLSQEQIQQLKNWVIESCSFWKRSVGSIYQILRVTEDADPELVKQVRISGGGKDREGKITPDRLRIVATRFPGAEYFAAQRAILRTVVEKRLYEREAEALVERITGLIIPSMDEDAVYHLANRIRVGQAIKNLGTPAFQKSEKPEDELEEDDAASWEYLEPTDEEIMKMENNSSDAKITIDPDEIPEEQLTKKSNLTSKRTGIPTGLVERLSTYGEGDIDSIKDLRQRNKDLTEALKTAHQLLANGDYKNGVYWWKIDPKLSVQERFFMDQLFLGVRDFDALCRTTRTPYNRALSFILSASKKRWLALNQEVIPVDIGEENSSEKIISDPEAE